MNKSLRFHGIIVLLAGNRGSNDNWNVKIGVVVLSDGLKLRCVGRCEENHLTIGHDSDR